MKTVIGKLATCLRSKRLLLLGVTGVVSIRGVNLSMGLVLLIAKITNERELSNLRRA